MGTPMAAYVSSVVDPKQDPEPLREKVIVGVTGHAQNGKDTIGQVFVDRGFEQFAFADALKSMALALDPWIDEADERCFTRLSHVVQVGGWEVAKTYPEVRRFLQKLGTEAVRKHIGEDAWVKALEQAVAKRGARFVVVTDVRFPNEAQWIKDHDGILIRTFRVNQDGSEFDNGVSREHDSERFVSDLPADVEIVTSTVDELRWKAQTVADQVLFEGAV